MFDVSDVSSFDLSLLFPFSLPLRLPISDSFRTLLKASYLCSLVALSLTKGDVFPPLFHAFSNSFLFHIDTRRAEYDSEVAFSLLQLLLVILHVLFFDRVVDVPVVKSVLPKEWLVSLHCVFIILV